MKRVFLNDNNCTTGTIVAIGTILAALAVYIGYALQNNNTEIQFTRYYDDDNLVRLNHTFYTEKSFYFTPKIKEQEFLRAFTKAIKGMKQCRMDAMLLRFFYGESGIGKTTMFYEVLKELKPFPYVLISLERGNTWVEIGAKFNMTSLNEKATEEFVFRTLTDYFNSLERESCPLIVIDGANRNPDMTNTFIAYWREISGFRPFALLMVSSDGSDDTISRGGGRVLGVELSPSETFIREYLKEYGVTKTSTISEIMEITANKIVYLSNSDLYNYGDVDLVLLEQIVQQQIRIYLKNLLDMGSAYQYFLELGRVLVTDPSKSKEILRKVPIQEANKIFNSNLLKRYGGDNYGFQNKAIERYFKKNLVY